MVFLIHTELRCTVNHTSDLIFMFNLPTSTTFIRHLRQTLFTLCSWQCRLRKQTNNSNKNHKQLATGNVIYKRNTEMLNNQDEVTNNTDIVFVWAREIDGHYCLRAHKGKQENNYSTNQHFTQFRTDYIWVFLVRRQHKREIWRRLTASFQISSTFTCQSVLRLQYRFQELILEIY